MSDSHLRRGSSCSSAYGSHEGGNSRGSVKDNIDSGHRHVRDGSYDSYTSYGKGSEDSIDESVFEVTYPEVQQSNQDLYIVTESS